MPKCWHTYVIDGRIAVELTECHAIHLGAQFVRVKVIVLECQREYQILGEVERRLEFGQELALFVQQIEIVLVAIRFAAVFVDD